MGEHAAFLFCGPITFRVFIRVCAFGVLMSETLLLVCVTIGCLCLTAITIAIVLCARDLRVTLRRVNALLPEIQHACVEARQSLHRMRKLLTGITHTAEQVEAVIQQMSEATSHTLDGFEVFKRRALTFWSDRFGNGARAEPRLHRRSR